MILVTGANGFLGRAVVERLLQRGESHMRCLVRSDRSIESLEATCRKYSSARVEICRGDLTSTHDAATATSGVSAIYHLAAEMRGAPSDLFMNTVVGSKNLLEAAIHASTARIVLVSSFGVYGTSGLARGACVDETTPLEQHPERRDVYSHCKLRQEQLFWEYRHEHRFELVVLRPGVVYGPGGTAISSRVGLHIFGVFWRMGGRNMLPLTYVENCADAIVIAGRHPDSDGQIYNVVDDDLVTAKEYLSAYRHNVRRLWVLPLPYILTRSISRAVERYHVYSKGQLPAVLTPYKSACLWKGHTFDNSKLKGIGWRPSISTTRGLDNTFSHFRSMETAFQQTSVKRC